MRIHVHLSPLRLHDPLLAFGVYHHVSVMRNDLFLFAFVCFAWNRGFMRAVLSFGGMDSVDAGILDRRLASSGFDLVGDSYCFIWLCVKIVTP